MAVISIQYKECSKLKNLGYKSVSVSYDGLRKKKIFKSGNFVKDWYDSIKFCILKVSNNNESICQSSTVNHFIMDGAQFDSAYLDTGGSEPELLYDDIKEDAIEFFVKARTKPTWKELKNMCEKSKNRRKK